MEDKYINFDWSEEIKQLADKAEALEAKYHQKLNEISLLHTKSCRKFLCKQRCKWTEKETEELKVIVKEMNQTILQQIELQRKLPDSEHLKDTLDKTEKLIKKSGLF